MAKELFKGNHAFAEAAIRAGVEAFYGYPITPSTEFLEYMSSRMPSLGRAFVQAESEVSAINMVYGAACTGKRVMTASSSPGVSLMMEGISYIAGTEVPAVVVNVMRGGPGLGNIAPSQGDYYQMVKGGGHGDYFPIVLAPASVQEAIDYISLAFDLAEKYRSIVHVIVDGNMGQMMEPAELPPMREICRRESLIGRFQEQKAGNPICLHRFISIPRRRRSPISAFSNAGRRSRKNEVVYDELEVEDAEVLVISFGTAGRVASSAVRQAREEGIKAGLLRPITLAPFPQKRTLELFRKVKRILVVEMNSGMMLDDIMKIVQGKVPIEFYGRMGGMTPLPDEILDEIRRVAVNKSPGAEDPRDEWMVRLEKKITGEN